MLNQRYRHHVTFPNIYVILFGFNVIMLYTCIMTLKEAIEKQGRKTSWLADQIGVTERTVLRWKANHVTPIAGHQKLLRIILDEDIEFTEKQ